MDPKRSDDLTGRMPIVAHEEITGVDRRYSTRHDSSRVKLVASTRSVHRIRYDAILELAYGEPCDCAAVKASSAVPKNPRRCTTTLRVLD
jgi:hypothetical protein